MPHYRFTTFIRTCLGLWLGGFAVASVLAQTPTGKAPLLLQRIDSILYGVDLLSLAVVDRHHVSGILVRVSAAKPSPPLDYNHFVVDCQGAMRLAQIASAASPMDLTLTGASARARQQAAGEFIAAANHTPNSAPTGKQHFKALSTLDGSRALALFTCAAMQRPGQAAPLAQDVYDNGGPSDLRTALCDLQPDGVFVTREDVTVRFSDSEKVVSVNQQWLTSGKVTDSEISFGSGNARWRIDRSTAEANLIDANGKVLFAGSCIAADRR